MALRKILETKKLQAKYCARKVYVGECRNADYFRAESGDACCDRAWDQFALSVSTVKVVRHTVGKRVVEKAEAEVRRPTRDDD